MSAMTACSGQAAFLREFSMRVLHRRQAIR